MVNEKSKKLATTKHGKTTTTVLPSTSTTSKVTSSSSSTSKQTSSSTSSSSTATVVEKSGSQTSIHSGVQIAEVTDLLSRSDSATSHPSSLAGAEYVVTTPDMASGNTGKVHYIFGGTQITEVGSSDFIRHEQIDGRNLATVPEVVFAETTSSSSSSVQQSSKSSVTHTTIDADGKADVQSREWGSSKNRSSADQFHAKSGTGMTPEVSYSEKHQLQKAKFDSGEPGKQPLFESSLKDSERSIQQKGNANATEDHKERSEKVKFDQKTGKYLTDSASRENSRVLDKDFNIIDSITLQQEAIKDSAEVINVIQDLSDRNRNIRHDVTDSSIGKSSSSTSTSKSTMQKSSSTVSDMLSSVTSTMDAAKIKDTTTTYTSKQYDDKTKTWKIVDQTTINEKDVRSDSPQKMLPAAGMPSRRSTQTPAAGVPSSRQSKNETFSKSSTSSVKETTTNSELGFQSPNALGFPDEPLQSGAVQPTQHQEVYQENSSKKASSSLYSKTASSISQIFDSTTNTWITVDQTNVSEKDIRSDAQPLERPAAGAPSQKAKPSTVESPVAEKPKNVRKEVYDEKTQRWKTVDIVEKPDPSTQLIASEATSFASKTASSLTEVFDSTTNKWKTVEQTNVSEKDISSKVQPTDGDTSRKTDQPKTVKKSYYDKKSQQWKSVDVIDLSDIKTESSLTEVFDTKTNTWVTVDQSNLITKNTSSVSQGPQPAAGVPSQSIPKTKIVGSPSSLDKPKTTRKEVYDEKTHRWKMVDIIEKPDSSTQLINSESTSSTSMISKSASSSTEVFDSSTNTWKTVDQSNVNESDIGSGTHEIKQPAAGAPSRRTPSDGKPNQPDSPKTTKKEIFDEKTQRWTFVDISHLPEQPSPVRPATGAPTDHVSSTELSSTTSVTSKSASSLTEVFDSTTNTWKTVDQTNVNEKDVRSVSQGPQPAAGAPSHRVPQHTGSLPNNPLPETTKKEVYDEKTQRWKVVDVSDKPEPQTSHRPPAGTPSQRQPDKEKSTLQSSSSTSVTSKTSSSLIEVFDSSSNTWKMVDQTNLNEKDVRSVSQSPQPAAGAPSRRTPSTELQKSPEKPTTTKKEVYDEKTQRWKVIDVIDTTEKPSAVRPAAGTPSQRPNEVVTSIDTLSSTSLTSQKVSSVTEIFDSKTNTLKTIDQTNNVPQVPQPTAGAPSRRSPKKNGDSPNPNAPKTTKKEVYDEKTQRWKTIDVTTDSQNQVRPAAGTPSRRPTSGLTTDTTTSTQKEVFDVKTQTWKFIDNARTNEEPTQSRPSDGAPSRGPTPAAGAPSRKLNLDSKHPHSLKTVDEVNTSDNTTFNNSTTTTISKAFDENTKTWRVVDEHTVHEKDYSYLSGPHAPKETPTAGAPSRRPTPNGPTDKRVTDIKSNTKTTETANVKHVYDERTKTWLTAVDKKSLQTKRPSIQRYISKAADGTFTTTYKKKVFDKRSGQWRVVEEKVYNNRHVDDHIPEMIDDVTNLTRTTYSTKIFDSKTGTWNVVEEKSFSDTKTVVPRDIVEEIERDHADVANITTTTEITKVSLFLNAYFL